MKLILKITAIVLLIGIYGCKDSMAQNEEERTPGSFTELKVSGGFNVFLEEGNKEKVKIVCKGGTEADEIVTEIRGDALYIKPAKWTNNVRADIYVTYKGLSGIHSSGACDIVGKDVIKASDLDLSSSGAGDMNLEIETNELDLSLSGSSDVELKGLAKIADIGLSGSSDVEAVGLKTEKCDISISGSGDVTISVSESLEATVSGSGSISYKGRPEIEKVRISGSGDIRSID